MDDIKKMEKIKKVYIILGSIVVFLLIIVFAFIQFIPIGYRMTVSLHGFDQKSNNIYINKNFETSTAEAVEIINKARERVAKYFGDIESNPIIIVCDDKAKLKRLGGDHDTTTAIIYNVYSYIAISPEYLNVDIIAHELTHAETHHRTFKGKLWYQLSIPTWFDEGVALQNDYRETYNEEAWKTATDNGKNVVGLSDIDNPTKFYAGNTEDRRYRYIVSKHELSAWIEQNGVPSLIDLLDKINQGENFNSLYFH